MSTTNTTNTTATPTQRGARRRTGQHRSRWAAAGAALAVTVGAGGFGLTQAAETDGPEALYVALDAPCRLVDSRPATQVGPLATPIGAGDTRAIAAHGEQGDCDIPTSAIALSINVTGLNATAISFFTLWPNGTPQPTVSNLNLEPGQPPTPNLANVKIGASGAISLFNAFGTADYIIDVSGYYVEETPPLLPTSSGSQADASVALVTAPPPAPTVPFTLGTTLTQTPAAGQLIVHATATVGSNVAGARVDCSLSPIAGIVDATGEHSWESAGSDGGLGTIAITRTFEITNLTTQFAVYLTCQAEAGQPVPGVIVTNSAINAIYVPGPIEA